MGAVFHRAQEVIMRPLKGHPGAYVLETEREAEIAWELARALPPGEPTQFPGGKPDITPELRRRIAAETEA